MHARWTRPAGYLTLFLVAFGLGMAVPGEGRAGIVGDLDPDYGFGGVGVDLKQLSTITGEAEDVVVQPDGKIVIVGRYGGSGVYQMFVTRLDPDGSFDGTFGGSSSVVTTSVGSDDSRAWAVALQADGKIVVAGSAEGPGGIDFAVVRYLADGTLDGTFGPGGKVITPVAPGTFGDAALDVVVQSDGKVIAGGSAFVDVSNNAAYAMVRYLSDGSLDSSYGSGGIVLGSTGNIQTAIYALALQSDGKLLVSGHGPLFRFNTDGTPDTTFGSIGTGRADLAITAHALVVQPDGKIAGTGISTFDLRATRWNSDGTVDATFNGGVPITGLFTSATSPTSFAIAHQPGGRLLVTTGLPKPALYAFTSSGQLDSSFGPFGDGISSLAYPALDSPEDGEQFTGRFTGLAILPDGDALAVGWGKYLPVTGFAQGLLTARYESTGCSGIAKSRMIAKHLDTAPGDDGLIFKGVFTRQVGAPAIDPSVGGVRLIDDSSFFDVTIPGGTGWKHNAALTKFVFKSDVGVQGITKVKVGRSGTIPEHYKFTVVGKQSDFTNLELPYSLTMAFDVASVVPADCATAQWPGPPYALQTCTPNSTGSTTVCK